MNLRHFVGVVQQKKADSILRRTSIFSFSVSSSFISLVSHLSSLYWPSRFNKDLCHKGVFSLQI